MQHGNINVKLSYMFRHLQVELYRMLKITVTLFGYKPMYNIT
jgi:hypothetical protein